jgi:Raf kinase inhibitor-like YbhB/YbcL family protein
MKFAIASRGFEHGATIPRRHTGDGPDLSPALDWTEPPAGTQSFALVADDPDAPAGTWVHWVAYNIPGELRGLDENVPRGPDLDNGMRQGLNDFRKYGYGGPAPPPGKAHRYFFKLYAVDCVLDLPAGARKENLVKAMDGHVLATAELMGRYQR